MLRGPALALVALLLTAGTALANSSSYSWTMTNTVVDGSQNGVYHTLTAGSLTVTGYATAYSRDSTYLSSPYGIHIEVRRKDILFFTTHVCGFDSTISSTLNVYRSYSASCGSQPAGDYFLIISKIADDGWNLSGYGTIATK